MPHTALMGAVKICPPKHLNCKLDTCQRALTSQDRIEIRARLTKPLFAIRPRPYLIVAVEFHGELTCHAASCQTHFMTSFLVTHSRCVNTDLAHTLKLNELKTKHTISSTECMSFFFVTYHKHCKCFTEFCVLDSFYKLLALSTSLCRTGVDELSVMALHQSDQTFLVQFLQSSSSQRPTDLKTL